MILLPAADTLEKTIQKGLALMGQSFHLRIDDSFETALARGQNIIEYEDVTDTLEVAVAVGYSIFANQHPLIDGNKRAGFLAIMMILQANNLTIDRRALSPESAIAVIEQAAAKTLSEAELTEALRPYIIST
ncbi:MAG TPA: type II toxin-antitoxin system death-on-curing family toxin [Rhodospirillaceae bacterium]|nr:type II toxin-antitoxin system death-on-curing family toxin [Rhodospirillaceae bacterium]MAX63990.1 type II toxin-antitoxin system death-on-curing family toxin [Rhodospirillaceae bacterium]MBB58925.1 type II toxin-antitoxin system death-on-curing family toxin [Rhodospirillaceae bacterium]HAE03922.1 type II toxin-antitoxin system death-on-curing family toxin [Rhodospirillaceae bacterium]HAJ20230.1 type II toxin-antitoxin system death-on-curing family toxin [Rhodospirillaceae bacterium]